MKLLNRLEEIFDRDKRAQRKAAEALYRRIVAAARNETFYRDVGVPDTLDGRFEMLALHTVLVCRRLAAEGEKGADLGQGVFDVMIEDLDLNLRELGVNDPSLGKRVKEMARAFYGRRDAYAAALDSGDEAALEEAINRNALGTVEPAENAGTTLAGYTRRTAESLKNRSLAALVSADDIFVETVT